jgi:hypothetical protein
LILPAGLIVTASHSLFDADWKNATYAIGPPALLQTNPVPPAEVIGVQGNPSGPQVGAVFLMIAVAQELQNCVNKFATFGANPAGCGTASVESVTMGSAGGPATKFPVGPFPEAPFTFCG